MGGAPTCVKQQCTLQTVGAWCQTANHGEIVLVHGLAGWGAWFSRWLGWSDYSHVGIVIVTADGMRYFLESVGHPDALECSLCQQHTAGPRLVPLAARMRQYCADSPNGAVDICTIQLEVEPSLAPKIATGLMSYAANVCGMHYQRSPLALLAADMHSPKLATLQHRLSVEQPGERKRLQCAGLVADSLCAAGVLRSTFNCDSVVPRHFATGQLAPTDYACASLACYSRTHKTFPLADESRIVGRPSPFSSAVAAAAATTTTTDAVASQAVVYA